MVQTLSIDILRFKKVRDHNATSNQSKIFTASIYIKRKLFLLFEKTVHNQSKLLPGN